MDPSTRHSMLPYFARNKETECIAPLLESCNQTQAYMLANAVTQSILCLTSHCRSVCRTRKCHCASGEGS